MIFDKELFSLLEKEQERQKRVVNLVASENYVSEEVLSVLGSELTNKYAEGYSALRYYGGNEFVDRIENLTIARAIKTFGLKSEDWAVNVQALSGSNANFAVYFALLHEIEDPKIMGLNLNHGGHLSHGSKVSVTGKLYKSANYHLGANELLDYDEMASVAQREKPHLIVAGYSAYSRSIDFAKFRRIADCVGAYLVADISHISGLVAVGEFPSPFYDESGRLLADVVTTTTQKTLRGPRAALIFSRTALSKAIDKAIFPGFQGGPHLNNIAATAVALYEADTPEFKQYIRQAKNNAGAMADEFASLGWRVVSGGTDTHLFLLDVTHKFPLLSGGVVSTILEKHDIIINKNMIPFDTRKPTDPSGIRIGTPAQTTRGWLEADFVACAREIDRIACNYAP